MLTMAFHTPFNGLCNTSGFPKPIPISLAVF